MKTTKRTTRVLECPCGAAFESEESIVARLRSGSSDALMRISANVDPDLGLDPVAKPADFRATEAVLARNPSKLRGGIGGGLSLDRNTKGNLDLPARSDLGSRSDLDLFPVDPPAPVLRLASSQAADPKKPRRARVAVNPVYSDAFKAFWALYPGFRKTEPDACWEIWRRDGLETIAPTIMAALGWQVESDSWTKEGGQFIPAPIRWLRKHRWKDERPGGARPVRASASDPGIAKLVAAANARPVPGNT